MNRNAAYAKTLEGQAVKCELCPHSCRIVRGKTGLCLTRSNIQGTLKTLNYCRPVSAAIDPIEKKPLYHFYPGSSIFSTGPNGCPLKCEFCQNHSISQQDRAGEEVTIHDLADAAAQHGSIGIAYTYSEPTIWFETIMEVGTIIKNRGLKNVMISNGFINPKPLAELSTLIDAWNIDIKSMNPHFYRRYCKAQLEPVLRACQQVKRSAHLEITNLLIPGLNDNQQEIRRLATFIAENLGKETPLHFSGYYPRYKMVIPATPAKTVIHACAIAQTILPYVYAGNIVSNQFQNTCCPSCNTILIERKNNTTKFARQPVQKNDPTGRLACHSCGFVTSIII